MRRLRIGSTLAGLLLFVVTACDLRGQPSFSVPSMPDGAWPAARYEEKIPKVPSVNPKFTIPVSPMGFSLPGNSYLLRRQQLVSLDFIGEDRLLFSFRVSSGLRERSEDDEEQSQQRIHATVVEIATGKAGPEADWTLPDRRRYLWMLNDGRFLLRTADGLLEGDRELKTKEYLRWPGRLLWIEMDPLQKFLIANSLETQKTTQTSTDDSGVAQVGKIGRSEGQPAEKSTLTIRTVKRETGEVVRTTQAAWTSQTSDWPMNSKGYVEISHETGTRWVMKLIPHTGEKGWEVADVDSTCVPQYSFVTDSELLISRCDVQEGWRLKAALTSGRTLWETKIGSNTMWPLMIAALDGSRVARETLVLKRSAEKYKSGVHIDDVQGQVVRVYDALTGKVALEAPVEPIYDRGGNVAISPSGRRVAILDSDAIRVYELPAATQSVSAHE